MVAVVVGLNLDQAVLTVVWGTPCIGIFCIYGILFLDVEAEEAHRHLVAKLDVLDLVAVDFRAVLQRARAAVDHLDPVRQAKYLKSGASLAVLDSGSGAAWPFTVALVIVPAQDEFVSTMWTRPPSVGTGYSMLSLYFEL